MSPAGSLAQKTASGFFWLLTQTVGAKVVGMAGQVVLAWVLSPEDFGLVGLAYTVTAFASLIHQSGLREILIHRQRHFVRWANAAFWMSLTLACLAGLAMAAAAPLAVWMYGEPRLLGLVLVLAATAPLSGLDVVPDARLVSELRFRYLALVKWVVAVLTVGLSVVFALLHMGAYAFVLPQPIAALVRLAMLWPAANVPVRRMFQFQRWRYLFSDSSMLFLASLFTMLTWQGDYIVLGMMHDAKTVGIYFFAFNLSIQAMVLLTSNLAGVLFPALSKLQADPVRQTQAFLRAAQLLAILGVPLCLLQAALAGPGVTLLFKSWWYPAIRVLQLLSLGMAVRVVSSPGGSLIQAQGRFRTYLIVNAVNATVFLTLVTLGASLGQGLAAAVYVAGAVMVYFMVVGPVFLYIAIHPGGGRWRDILRVYAAPMLAGAIATAVAVGFGRLVPTMGNAKVRSAIRIVVITFWAMALYIPLIRWAAPEAFGLLVARVRSFYPRRTTPATPPLPGTSPAAAP